MSLRSRLLATVALPVFSVALWSQATGAEEITAPIILAQEDAAPANREPLPPEQPPVQSDANEIQRQADEQMKAAEEERKRQERELEEEAQKAREQAQAEQKAAEEEAARQAEAQRKATEKEAERQAQELEAEAQKAKQQTEQDQKAVEEEAQRQVEEQKKAAEQEKQRQLEEQKAIEDQAKKEAERSQREIEKSAEPERVPASPADEVPPEPAKPDTREQVTPPPDTTGQPQDSAPALKEQPAGKQQPRDPTQPEQEQEQEPKPNSIEAPAESDEDVVLPVDNGAAILDSNKDAENMGAEQSDAPRRKEHAEQSDTEENSVLPTDDAAAQSSVRQEIPEDLPSAIEANLSQEGRRIEEAPAFAVPETTNIINNTVVNNKTVNNIDNRHENIRVVERLDHRVVLDIDNRSVVRNDDRPRLRRNAEESFYEELPRGRLRETIIRPGGYRIVTLYDRYGDVIQRSRIDRDGKEYLLLYAPEYEHNPRGSFIDVGYDLPPMRLSIPASEYMIDVSDEPDADLYEFFTQPPIEPVERLYTLEEVRRSARLRDKMRRVDLDTIEFATGSAEVSLSQAKTLRKVADAIQKALEKDPGETFLIEGHTDAVGSDRSNLVLSDQRAESVAILLSDVYDVPAENLVTQGYGERYLKIKTQAAEQENRRVTIRRITPLVRPVAQR